MFCSNCGTKLPDDARFCVNCGNPMASAPAAPAENPAPVAPVYNRPAAPVYSAPAAPAPKKAKKSGINWKVFIIMLLVGALIIGGGGFLIYSIIEGDLFGSSNSSRKDDDDEDEDDDKDKDDDEDEEPQADAVNPYAGWNEYSVGDLVFYLPEEFEADYIEDEEAYFYSDDYEIEVASGLMSDIDSDITTSAEFAQMLIQSAPEEYDCESGTSNGVSYVVVFDTDYEEYMVVGFYVEGEYGWIISAYGDENANIDDLISYVTSGEL